MKRYGRACIALATIGVSLFVAAKGFLAFKSHAALSPETSSADLAPPDVRVQHMHVVEQLEATTGWEVFAKEAEFYDEERLTVLHQVRARFSQHPAPALHMTAERGQIDSVTGNINMQGDINLQYQEGYTIETEKLDWHAMDGTLYTDAPVKLHTATVHITGTGLQSKVDQHRIDIQRDVRASFQLPGVQ